MSKCHLSCLCIFIWREPIPVIESEKDPERPRAFIFSSSISHTTQPFRSINLVARVENPSPMPVLEGENPSPKEGVKVLGCDEKATNSDPTDISQQLENLTVEDASSSSTGCREFSSDREIGANEKTASTNEGSCNKLPARSQLHEICVAKKWKLPLYECCKEEGPPHMRMFTYKVIVEIEETEKTVLECFGAPHSKKKSAAEHAAEAALWYLKNIGYDSKDR